MIKLEVGKFYKMAGMGKLIFLGVMDCEKDIYRFWSYEGCHNFVMPENELCKLQEWQEPYFKVEPSQEIRFAGEADYLQLMKKIEEQGKQIEGLKAAHKILCEAIELNLTNELNKDMNVVEVEGYIAVFNDMQPEEECVLDIITGKCTDDCFYYTKEDAQESLRSSTHRLYKIKNRCEIALVQD